MESRPGVTIQQGVQILSVGGVVIQWPPVSGVAIQHEKSVESWAQPVESRPHGSKFNGVKIQSYTGKAANNVIIIWKRYYWMFWRWNWIPWVHFYLLGWRKTTFFCIISILLRKQLSKLINVNCLHFIGCQSYTKILLNHASYQILTTALLPFFQSILHLL